MDYTKPIDLKIAEKLRKDEDYRKAFFRAEAADSIALRIRDLRKERDDLTQAELAARADMKQSAISRIEQAEYASWSFNTLSRVAEALDSHLVVTFERNEDAIRKYEKGDVPTDAQEYVTTAAASTVMRALSRLRVAWVSRHKGIVPTGTSSGSALVGSTPYWSNTAPIRGATNISDVTQVPNEVRHG